jgi:glycosyltransferase involved in cell wall biosynthesis
VAPTIRDDVAALAAVLEQEAPAYEVIVVVDGDPATAEATAEIAHPRIRVVAYDENQGKGFAVLIGMQRAAGRLVGFMDAGGDIDPIVWKALLEIQRAEQADIVVASKRHPASSIARYPPLRRIYSLGYQMLVRLIFRLRIRDTQVGAKLYSREVIDKVVPLLLVKRFAFDIEFLAVARHFGFRRLAEAPVALEYRFSSSVDVRAVWRMLWDTAAVFYRLSIQYYDRAEPRRVTEPL